MSRDDNNGYLYSEETQFRYWSSSLFNEVFLRRDISTRYPHIWAADDTPEFERFMQTLRNLAKAYEGKEKELKNWSEIQTISSWIQYVLKALGWCDKCEELEDPFLYEKSFRYKNKTIRTDILIVDFPQEKEPIERTRDDLRLTEARNSVLMPVEAKYWNRLEHDRQGDKVEKNRARQNSDDIEKTSTGNDQIVKYMDILHKEWGVLTDGARWRLFHRGLSGEDSSRYFEFNLSALIQSMQTESTPKDTDEVIAFAKYFFNIFGKHAYAVHESSAKSFVDELLDHSKKYIDKVEVEIKDRFLKAMNYACNEIYDRSAESSETELSIEEIRSISESALFNTLFTRALESRNILPVTAGDYRKISLTSIIDKIEKYDPDKDDKLNVLALHKAFKKGNGNSFEFKPDGTEIHKRIVRLTKVIHDGNAKRDDFGFEIAGFRESVFSNSEWRAFQDIELTNMTWVKILFELGYAESTMVGLKFQQIPYSYFSPRQLGSIYESFLEFRLDEAESDMVYEDHRWKKANLDRGAYLDTDLPCARKGKLFFVPDNSERKATGSYYTPEYLVRHIVESSLDPLVADLNSEQVLELAVCDPSMGSGHFLVSALNTLTRVYLERLSEESDGYFDITTIEAKRIVLNACIYGVDVNPRAVKLAKMSLWLESAHINKKLERLNDQLKTGDSYVDDKSMSSHFFDYAKGFPQVFTDKDAPGFDSIVSNPPWGRCLTRDQEVWAKSRYQTIGREVDTYTLFIQRSCELLSDDGYVGCIVPSTYMIMPHFRNVRSYLLEHFQLKELTKLGVGVFEDAIVESSTIVGIKGQTTAKDKIRVAVCQGDAQSFLGAEWRELKAKSILQDIDMCFRLDVSGQDIYDRIVLNSQGKLGDFLQVKSGIMTKGEALIHNRSRNKKCKPLLRGKLVLRGKIMDEPYYIEYDRVKAKRIGYQLRDERIFLASPKIVIRQTGDSLVCSVDVDQHYALKNLHVIYSPDIEDVEFYRAVSCLLNSKLYNYAYQQRVPERGRAMAEVKATYLKELPFPKLSEMEVSKLARLYSLLAESSYCGPAAWEYCEKIDEEVYKIFGLSQAQINRIEVYFHESDSASEVS